MSPRHAILRACLATCVPTLLVCVVGAVMLLGTSLTALGWAIIIGGIIALPLVAGGAAIIAALAQAPLPVALMAALAAFALRVIGAGAALALIPGLTHAGITAAALVGSLVAALAIEMYGLARTTLQEPVRA